MFRWILNYYGAFSIDLCKMSFYSLMKDEGRNEEKSMVGFIFRQCGKKTCSPQREVLTANTIFRHCFKLTFYCFGISSHSVQQHTHQATLNVSLNSASRKLTRISIKGVPCCLLTMEIKGGCQNPVQILLSLTDSDCPSSHGYYTIKRYT